MFGFFKKSNDAKAEFESQESIVKFVKKIGHEKAGAIIRAEALTGNVQCQIFLSGLCLHFSDHENAERFTKLAAESGDAMSQANLALMYFKKIDATPEFFSEYSLTMIRKARYWSKKAEAQGFKNSVTAFLQSFPDVGEEA